MCIGVRDGECSRKEVDGCRRHAHLGYGPDARARFWWDCSLGSVSRGVCKIQVCVMVLQAPVIESARECGFGMRPTKVLLRFTVGQALRPSLREGMTRRLLHAPKNNRV